MSNQQESLRATLRSRTGKGAARQLRRAGKLPAVVYGAGDVAVPLELDTHEFERLMSRIHAATTVIELDVENGDPQQVLIREIQRHPFRPLYLHVDFYQIKADETIKVAIPVHVEGHAKGVTMGGILQQIRHELEIECLPHEIPAAFTVDVSGLDIGDAIHIGDVDTGGVTVLEEPDLTVCMVVPPSVAEVEEAEEEGEEGVTEEGAIEGEPESESGDDE